MALVIAVALVLAFLTDSLDLRVAMFGLIGTVTGALGTYEAAHAAYRRDSRAAARAAGRLLQDDLVFGRTRARYAKANNRFWAPRHDLRLDGWECYRESVAKAPLEPGAWQSIAAGFEAMRALQSKCISLRETYGERPVLGPRSQEAVNLYLERSQKAIAALAELSGDRPPDEPVIADEPS